MSSAVKNIYASYKCHTARKINFDNQIYIEAISFRGLRLLLKTYNIKENLLNIVLSIFLTPLRLKSNFVVFSKESKFSLMINCASIKYPFMNSGDIILSCLYGPPSKRGEKNGFKLINTCLSIIKFSKVWYITDVDNCASNKTAAYCGLQLQGKVRKINYFRFSDIYK